MNHLIVVEEVLVQMIVNVDINHVIVEDLVHVLLIVMMLVKVNNNNVLEVVFVEIMVLDQYVIRSK